MGYRLWWKVTGLELNCLNSLPFGLNCYHTDLILRCWKRHQRSITYTVSAYSYYDIYFITRHKSHFSKSKPESKRCLVVLRLGTAIKSPMQSSILNCACRQKQYTTSSWHVIYDGDSTSSTVHTWATECHDTWLKTGASEKRLRDGVLAHWGICCHTCTHTQCKHTDRCYVLYCCLPGHKGKLKHKFILSPLSLTYLTLNVCMAMEWEVYK